MGTNTKRYSIGIGNRFGRLVIKSFVRKEVDHKRKKSRACVNVVCDCGTWKIIQIDDLIQGKVKSCGCLRREFSKNNAKPIEQRFWVKVNKDGNIPEHRPDLGRCWIWTASTNSRGYGTMKVDEGSTLAHRISYRVHGYIVPDGMQLDHLCRVRNCVNPDHLEVVTPRINVRRGYSPASANAKKTHCPQGHLYNEENTYIYKGNRQCRICGRKRSFEYQKRKRGATLK